MTGVFLKEAEQRKQYVRVKKNQPNKQKSAKTNSKNPSTITISKTDQLK